MFVSKVGYCRISLILLCVIALTVTACTQTAPMAHKHTLSADPVVRWIQQNAIPLRTTDPGGSAADLGLLKQIVRNANIVGLGEGTHGTHEFIDIKARLAEFLITDMGFTTFIMENDWGTSKLINAYINGTPGDIDSVMRTGLFGSWQTQEYRALFEWMRAYNSAPTHTTKIHFLGMDCQAVSQSDFTAVENYLQKVDPQQATNVQQLYAPIMTASLPNPYVTYVSSASSAKQKYPLYLLDLRKVPPGPVAGWANGPSSLLLYGLGGEESSSTGSLSQWFDVIIHVQQTTPSTPL